MENMVTLPPKYLKPIYMNVNSTDFASATTTTTTTDLTANYSTTQNYQFESSSNDYQIPTTETTSADYTTGAVDYTTSTDYSASYAQPTYNVTQTTSTLASTPVIGGDFKLMRRGSGITLNEQNNIVSVAQSIIQGGLTPISNKTAQGVKKKLGGDWLVIVYPEGKPIDFNMTCVQGNDYLYFILGGNAFQVCRLK